jgi:isochorismate hydrolase
LFICASGNALIISGSETDVCVLATVLSAVDLGYRVIIARDAGCSSSDEGHDMLLRLYHTRFSEQIETADAETILSRCQRRPRTSQIRSSRWRNQRSRARFSISVRSYQTLH